MTGQDFQHICRPVRAVGAALALALLGVGSAQAQSGAPSPVLVELFTSQGCISCPPADEVFSRLADEPGVIALALHVDYWDYLGWQDAFADPAYTARQKRYAVSAGEKMIYTPQVILGGTDRLQGAREAEIRSRITELGRRNAPVALDLRRQGGELEIALTPGLPLTAPALVSLVRYLPGSEVSIERGENAGQTITYRNVVTSWTQVAEWPGQDPLRLAVPLEGEEPAVVIIQEPGPGPVLAVRRLD